MATAGINADYADALNALADALERLVLVHVLTIPEARQILIDHGVLPSDDSKASHEST